MLFHGLLDTAAQEHIDPDVTLDIRHGDNDFTKLHTVMKMLFLTEDTVFVSLPL